MPMRTTGDEGVGFSQSAHVRIPIFFNCASVCEESFAASSFGIHLFKTSVEVSLIYDEVFSAPGLGESVGPDSHHLKGKLAS